MWTDKKAREFIADEYPWFLETFDSYPYPIQRADTIRYFVLHHFGGIYIDLDDVCSPSRHINPHPQLTFPRGATAVSTRSSPIPPGSAAPSPPAYPTT